MDNFSLRMIDSKFADADDGRGAIVCCEAYTIFAKKYLIWIQYAIF
jgi:hypothetical protein